jgi:hypothetical protein
MIEAFTIGQARSYTGTADFFRLIATVGSCDIRFSIAGRIIAERLAVEAGFAEQFKIAPFDKVTITSNAVQNIQFETALGSEIRYDRGASSVTGTVAISGAIALDAATLAALENTSINSEQYGGSYVSTASLTANTAVQIISAAANTNGISIISAQYCPLAAGGILAAFLAKATAPTSVTDGVPILIAAGSNIYSGCMATMAGKIIIPAGLGVFTISNTAEVGGFKSMLYKLL